jgi:hypothetical protein
MIVNGVGSALTKSLGLMGWVYRSSLGRDGRSFLDFLDSRWVMTSRLVFGMMCGVGEKPLKVVFLELYSIACLRDASMAGHL